MMKRYLIVCPEASSHGLPWKSGLRTHMLEGSGNYSVKDFIDIQSGVLIDELQSAYNTMKAHITETCQLCKARFDLFLILIGLMFCNVFVIEKWIYFLSSGRHCERTVKEILHYIKKNKS